MAHGDDSEAWRGGGDEPAAGNDQFEGLLRSVFGPHRKLTPEEQAALTAKVAERRAIAAARSLVLPSYSGDGAVCIKCGGRKIATQYCRGGTTDADVLRAACYLDTAGQEHLTRQCRRCGWLWNEKTKDAS